MSDAPGDSRNNNGTFRKGASGNPKGRKPKAVTVPFQQIVPGTSHTDGFVSTTTGIGTSTYDKRLSHLHVPAVLSYQEAISLWATSDLARRAIQDPVEDAFRQGFKIEIQDDGEFDQLIDSINSEILKLKVVERLIRAMCMERAFGGCAILIGANDNRPMSAPLKLSEANGISWLSVLEPLELVPYTYYRDPNSKEDGDKYGEPETYMLTAFTTAGATGYGPIIGGMPVGERSPPPEHIIHASRLIVFGGIRVSRYQIRNNIAGSLWGESMLAGCYEPLRDVEVAFHAAAALATETGQPTLYMDGLMEKMAKEPKAVLARVAQFQNTRSAVRIALLDIKEKLERQGGEALTGVPELLAALMGRFAASIPMPASRLMGASPKSVGTDIADEIRFYNDDIRASQTRKIYPNLRMLIQMIMQAQRKRGLPKRWDIKFNDLTQLTDAEMAEAHLTQARTDSMYIKSGVATPNEIRRSRFFKGYSFNTQVDETKKAPGFLAPPPNGTPGSPHNPTGGPAALNSHPVGGYTRKNPSTSGTEPAAPQGGDQIPGNGPNSRKDAASICRDAITELEYQAERLRTARDQKLSPAMIQLLEGLVSLAAQEKAEHDAGTCDPETCDYPHDGIVTPGGNPVPECA